VSFEQSFERGEVLSISHFLRQVVPKDCGFSVFLGWSQHHVLGKRFIKVSYEC